MANIIQNISQNRTNKTITMNDLKYAFALSWLTFYPAKTLYADNSKYEFSNCPYLYVYCVKGTNEGKAKTLWHVYLYPKLATSPQGFVVYSLNGSGSRSKITYFSTEVLPSNIHSSLKVAENEIKILIEPVIYHPGSFQTPAGAKLTPKEAFKFYLINPKYYKNSDGYFGTVTIFTPKPGLFDENGPQ